MEVAEAIRKIASRPKKMTVVGIEFDVYPLSCEEYFAAKDMWPKNPEDIRGSIAVEMYIIACNLKKNDPNFDEDIFKSSMANFNAFEPMFLEVWNLSNESSLKLKKKISG